MILSMASIFKSKKPPVQESIIKEWLQLFPVQNCNFLQQSDGRIILELPRSGNKFLLGIITLFAKSPTVKIKLDELGSFIWEQCTGEKSIQQICDDLVREFGESVYPTEERTVRFFQRLYHYRLIQLFKESGQ